MSRFKVSILAVLVVGLAFSLGLTGFSEVDGSFTFKAPSMSWGYADINQLGGRNSDFSNFVTLGQGTIDLDQRINAGWSSLVNNAYVSGENVKLNNISYEGKVGGEWKDTGSGWVYQKKHRELFFQNDLLVKNNIFTILTPDDSAEDVAAAMSAYQKNMATTNRYGSRGDWSGKVAETYQRLIRKNGEVVKQKALVRLIESGNVNADSLRMWGDERGQIGFLSSKGLKPAFVENQIMQSGVAGGDYVMISVSGVPGGNSGYAEAFNARDLFSVGNAFTWDN